MYPRVLINLSKFKNNVQVVKKRLDDADINIFGVSKVLCGDVKMAGIFHELGLEAIADSRVENLKKMKDIPIKKVLLRLPMQSEVMSVVKHADISLNSEISTIELLSSAAMKQGKIHGVILMVDLGDLREGFFREDELFSAVEKAAQLPGIEILGIGTNLTCFGAIIPKLNHMTKLAELKNIIEKKYNLQLKYISAGNSSTYYLTEKHTLPKEINNLRIGEIFVRGVETAYREKVAGTFDDVFQLEAEIIELKTKPSLPVGEKGTDAFGNDPIYVDKGDMKRAICAVGRQDADVEGLIPLDETIEVIGSSSDHIILDVTHAKDEYNVGETMKFNLTYGGILSVMTSEYVQKVYIENHKEEE